MNARLDVLYRARAAYPRGDDDGDTHTTPMPDTENADTDDVEVETAAPTETAAPPSRESLEATLATIVEHGRYKSAGSGRIRSAENERVRAQWARTAAYAANSLRQLRADRELEELSERVDALEDAPSEPARGVLATEGET